MDMQHTISLLEQCVLYNKPDYNPFSTCQRSDLSPKTSTEVTDSVETSPKTDVTTQTELGKNCTTSVLTIDLDFDRPLKSGSVIRATVPLARSTGRRPGNWQAKTKRQRPCDCYHDLKRVRKKVKPGSVVVEPPCVATLVQPSSTVSQPAFLSFPGEVRDLIYRYLFSHARLYISQSAHCSHAFDTHLAVRFTCRSIYIETARPLYALLTVVLVLEHAPRIGSPSVNSLIPRGLFDKLECLRIATNIRAYYSDVGLARLPALRQLTFTAAHLDYANVAELTAAAKSYLKDAESAMARLKEDEMWQLTRSMHDPSHSLVVRYEHELWGTFISDRSRQMGSLKKHQYQTTLVAYSNTDGGQTLWSEIDLELFEQQSEMYRWMEQTGKRAGHGHASMVLLRLQQMRYHRTLDTIESGMSRLEDKTSTPEGTGNRVAE